MAKYKPVPAAKVREWIDEAVSRSRARVRRISERFVAGKITLPAWSTQVQAEIKVAHTAMAEIASGGRAQFTAKQAGRLGQRLKEQYKYLGLFSNAIENGDVKLGAGLIARAELYAEGERATYEGMRRGNHKDAGFEQERSMLGDGDHCGECIDEEARGWVAIGELVPVGERQCLANCACEMSYQMTADRAAE